MFVKNLLLVSNPFFSAYFQSDYLGKLIFISLIALSIVSWTLLIQKGFSTFLARKNARQFQGYFEENRHIPLTLQWEKSRLFNPFYTVYAYLKKQTVEMLNKNRHLNKDEQLDASFLTIDDISTLQMSLNAAIASETKVLEKNLFVLSTIVSLAPFLGLLGTVWGILNTFSTLQLHAGGTQAILGGLSLALATTVLGLIDAIPALIGYNYFKNMISELEIELEKFATEILSMIEIQYRQN